MKINLNKGQEVYLTSDTHYNHTNLCKGTSQWENTRPGQVRNFDKLEEMNNTIVNNINEMVGENDVLIHFGDFSFSSFNSIVEFRNKIVCKNIYLIFGNHDHHIINNKENCQSLFAWCGYYLNAEIIDSNVEKGQPYTKTKFICSHFPIASWEEMGRGRVHLHGHTHLPSHLKLNNRALDVGMDGNNLKPYNLKEVMKLMKGQPIGRLILPQDHHE